MPSAIETQGLTRRFGQRLAVDAISMTVPERSIYGFLGRNGAGKTTTIKLLLGLLHADAGQARIAGIDIATDRLGAARKVGALLEAQGFYPQLSGHENLDLTRRLLGLPPQEVDRVLDVTEMTAHGRRRVADYSMGMRQRLGLARAMARELGTDGVRVNCITPGLIETDISKGALTSEKKAEIAETIPLARLGRADDIAGACVFLASPLSTYCTGITLDVNGGMLIH